jgi:hypothetical protein
MTDAHDLYGLPLDRFVSERGTLAKALKAQGSREEAARVAALRKPSVAAWTVNQIARTQTRSLADLFDAGDELQRAQADLLAGKGDARALRGSAERERAAVTALTDVARGLLSSDGHEPTASTLERVSETLHAAALDAGVRAQVRDGCLERELRRVGFGDGEQVGPSPPRAREHLERERAERLRAEQLKAARKDEADARRRAERAARELQSARERRDRAAGVLREAEEALASAGERAEEAALEHRRAQQALESV